MKRLFPLLLLIIPSVCWGQNPVGQQASASGNPTNVSLTAVDTGTCLAGLSAIQQLPNNAGTSTVTLAGTFSATVTVRLSANGGATWVTQGTQSSAGTVSYSVAGYSYICADPTSYSSGIIQITINSSLASSGSGGSGTCPTGISACIDATASKYGLKANVKTAIGATWSNSSQTVTVGAKDPQPSSGDTGKIIWGMTTCNSGDGEHQCTSNAIGQGTISGVSGAAITTSTTTTAANQTATAGGFTGWVNWGNDDAAALQSAWSDAIAASNNAPTALILPCGVMMVQSMPFLKTTAQSTNYSTSIHGCPGKGSIILSSPNFNYSSCGTNACIYEDDSVNALYTNESASQSIETEVSIDNVLVWGGSYPGITNPPASGKGAIQCRACLATNVDVIDWNWHANNNTNTNPGWYLLGGQLFNSGSWDGGNESIHVAGNMPNEQIPNTIVGGVFTNGSNAVGRWLIADIAGTELTTYGVQTFGNQAFWNNSGTWTDHGSFLAEIHANAGNVSLHGTTSSQAGNFGVFLLGTATITSEGSPIMPFVSAASGTTFVDAGGNAFQYANANWALSAGSNFIGEANSINQTALTTAKTVLSAGWGSTAAVTSPLGGTAPVQFTITNSGTGQGASPTITYTFPSKYPVAPFSCSAVQTGGTNATGTFTSSSLSQTGVTFTFSLTPTASSTEIVQVTCITP